MNFEIYLNFLIKPFSMQNQKSQDKNLNILRPKRTSKIREKALFTIFQRLSLK